MHHLEQEQQEFLEATLKTALARLGWQVFVKAGDGRSDLRLQNGSSQPGDAAPGKEPGSGEVAGTVSDSEQVDRMAAQVRQSSRREGTVGKG